MRFTKLVLVAGLVAAAGQVALATPAHAVCEVSVHDHTPGTYPGGLHIHNTCFDVVLPPLS